MAEGPVEKDEENPFSPYGGTEQDEIDYAIFIRMNGVERARLKELLNGRDDDHVIVESYKGDFAGMEPRKAQMPPTIEGEYRSIFLVRVASMLRAFVGSYDSVFRSLLRRSRGAVTREPIPPGRLALTIAGVLMTPAARKRLIEPAIADIQFEHAEAVKAGRTRFARWVVIRGYLYLLWPAIVGAFALVRELIKLKGA